MSMRDIGCGLSAGGPHLLGRGVGVRGVGVRGVAARGACALGAGPRGVVGGAFPAGWKLL